MGTTNIYLNGLIEFLNARFESMSESELVTTIYTYIQFIFHSESKYEFIDIQHKTELLYRDIVPPSKKVIQAAEERKKFFSEIQQHLRARVDTIIINRGTSHITGLPKTPVIEPTKGSRQIVLAYDEDAGERFLKEIFVPDKMISSKELDLEAEKLIADLAFVDLFFDRDIRVDGFNTCETCGKYFYEPTKRRRAYCSDACSGVKRQRRYRSSERKSDDGSDKK
jgi:hypothetical protein